MVPPLCVLQTILFIPDLVGNQPSSLPKERRSSMPEITAPCTQCHQPFLLTKKWQRDNLKAGKNLYCSDTCRREAVSKRSSETMARTNKIYASQRMKRN